MSLENTDIYLFDRTAHANPIAGVVVKVMNQAGTVVIGLGTTNVNGIASFLLPSDTTYQLRFFKQAVSFSNPLFIVVQQAPALNSFNVFCEPFVPPISTDVRLCMASGFFRRPDGSPAPNVDMHFIAKFNPILLEGSGVLTERVSIRTDKNGYAQITLIRFGQYDVTLQGTEDSTRQISVPDQQSVNLPDLLFATVAQITFSPTFPLVLPFNTQLAVTPTVISSDGRILEGTDTADVNWSSDNPSVLTVGVNATQVVLFGLAVGTANLIATRGDQTLIRIPNTPIIGIPAAVTVQ